jgi:hypothetical protein
LASLRRVRRGSIGSLLRDGGGFAWTIDLLLVGKRSRRRQAWPGFDRRHRTREHDHKDCAADDCTDDQQRNNEPFYGRSPRFPAAISIEKGGNSVSIDKTLSMR